MNKFKIENAGDTSRIYITTDIGGWDGIQASELVPEIHNIKSDKIDIHVNSMGGDVFQATGIFNAIQAHPAYVTAYVDGVAASAASFLIQAADKIVMGQGTQLMIHDASGMFQGNKAAADEFGKLLDSVSDNIAEFYASRAGGDKKEWRKRMKAETWYTAEEAVAAGLADEIGGRVLTPANKTEMLLVLSNRADVKYKGRDNAPAPFASGEVKGSYRLGEKEPVSADKEDVNNTSEPILDKDALLNILRDAFKEDK